MSLKSVKEAEANVQELAIVIDGETFKAEKRHCNSRLP